MKKIKKIAIGFFVTAVSQILFLLLPIIFLLVILMGAFLTVFDDSTEVSTTQYYSYKEICTILDNQNAFVNENFVITVTDEADSTNNFTGSYKIFSTKTAYEKLYFKVEELKEKESITLSIQKANALAVVGSKVGNAVENLIQTVLKGLGDLKPLTLDNSQCSTCKCEITDNYFNSDGTRKQETKRLDKDPSATGEESYKKMDWQYTGWTVDDSDYWDVDYDKFTYKDLGSDEFLFEHNVNDYSLITDKGVTKGHNSTTYEYRYGYSGKEEIATKLDENTRNGTFIRSTDGKTEWLDFGDYRFQCYDGRIMSAFAPMVIVGEDGIQEIMKAKQYFHKGDVWEGSESSYSNNKVASIWVDCVPRGTYIDVVFENNTTNQQVVIPFIYADAKNCHWFDSMGQRADQRYGQLTGNVNKMKNNGSIDREEVRYKATFKVYCDTQEEFNAKYQKGERPKGIMPIDLLRSYLGEESTQIITNETLHEGTQISGLDCSETIFSEYVFIGTKRNGDNCYLILDDFQAYTIEKTEYFVSDSDIITYKAFSPLELIRIDYNSNLLNKNYGVQDMNVLISKTLLDGYHWEEGVTDNSRPNWRLIGMRVYKNACKTAKDFLDVSQDKDFEQRSKEFETTDSIPNANQIVSYCGTDCKCNLCLKVAR